jgi:hypothetical protein
MAPMGTVWTGPLYCGYKAKTTDANGRPVCGIHKNGTVGIEWFGDRRRYPYGTGGRWNWNFERPVA